jgi:hypothetical protein
LEIKGFSIYLAESYLRIGAGLGSTLIASFVTLSASETGLVT